MVEQTHLANAAKLNQEYQTIDRAIHVLDDGGRILAMMIGRVPGEEHHGPPGPPLPDGGIIVRTETLEYPPQMVAGIKQQLTARQTAIREELRKMGVTGLAAAH